MNRPKFTKKISLLPQFNMLKKFEKNTKILGFIDTLSENALRRISISFRLIASFILLSFIPLLIVGYVAVNKSSKAMEENVSRYSIEIAKQLSGKISAELKKFSDMMIETSVSKEISNFSSAANKSDFQQLFTIMRDLESYFTNKTVSSSLEFIGYVDDKTGKFVGGKQIIYRDNKDGIYKKIISSKGKAEWIYMKDAERDESSNSKSSAQTLNMPVLFKKAVNVLSSEVLGVVYMVPNKDTFNKLLSGIVLDEAGEGEVFLLNQDNLIVGSSNAEKYGIPITNEIYDKINNLEKSVKDTSQIEPGYFRIKLNGVDNLVCYSFLTEGWKVVTAVPFENLMKETNEIGSIVFVIGLICILFALFFSYMVTRSVSIPIGHINNAMEELKKGDFTQQLNVKYKDEISTLADKFNSMIIDIRMMINDVKKITHEVVKSSKAVETHSIQALSASEQIAEAVGEMAIGSSEQAFESQKGKENMDALAEKLNMIVENTAAVQETTNKTKKLSEDSIMVVNDLNDKAKEASSAAETIVAQINDLNHDMKQITNIIKVIVNIAEQTNLLALNAAIEAARAGEAGKGFAVVADEVRKLAEQSKNASSTISSIIAKIMAKTSQVVDAANTASDTINKQMSAVHQTDETFKSIISATKEIVVQLDKMNAFVKSIDEMKEVAVKSMESISMISQSSAAASEEVNATTEEQIASANQLADLSRSLNELAVSLEHSIVKFKV